MQDTRTVRRLVRITRRGAESAIAWSLMAVFVRVASGLFLLPLMVRDLPSYQLGLWYVFLTLQGIAGLFDLGFSPSVTRAAGYLWGGARQLNRFGVATTFDRSIASPPNFNVLNRLVATMRIYYRYFGVVFGALMLLVGGAWIWYKTYSIPDRLTLRLCYIIFVVGGFLNATGDLWPALLSGINAVRTAQKLIFVSVLLSSAIIAVGLLNHFEIWALVIGTFIGGVFLRTAGRASLIRAFGENYQRGAEPDLQLVITLWPTAWRTGIVSLGSYLVLSANTLICSAFLDLKITASYGLTVSIISMLTYASSIFTHIKLPIVNQLRATAATNQIIEIWIRRTRISIVLYLLGAVLLLSGGHSALRFIGARTEFLPLGQLGVSLLVIGLEMHHVLYAGLVVSENQNPFVQPALFSGIGTVLLSLLLTPRFGVWGMLLAQGLVQASFNNWWTVHRAIRGLGLTWTAYWQKYIMLPIGI